MTSSVKVRAGFGLAAVALLASACGGGGSDSNDNGGDNGGTKSSFNAALAYKVINASDKKGGTLRLGASEPFDSLDPVATYYGYSWTFRRLWDRQMFQFKPVPGPGSLELAPDISEDMGKASDNNKTWTYKIRKGVKFANGATVTSKEIKYAIERDFAMDVLGANGGGPTYLVQLLGGADSYPGPYKDTDPNHLGLKTVETPDDNTIVFHLSKPFGQFNYLLALPTSTPVPIDVDQNKATGGAKYANHPISSGPYKVDKYDPSKLLTLSRNPYWDPKTDDLHKALPDKIELTIGTNSDTLDQQLLNNQIDFVIDTPIGAPARAKILQNKKTTGANTDVPVESYTTQYLDINKQVAPFDNIHCRKAVAYAIDKVSLQAAYGGPDYGGDIAHQMTPPVSTSYEKDYDPYPSGADNHGDLEKAKQELAACGHPNGFSTKIAARKTATGPKVALSVQNSLKRVGINVTYFPTQRGADPSSKPAQAKKNGLGIINMGWGADFPTDYGFYEFIGDPRAIPEVGNFNRSIFDDPKASELIDKATSSSGDESVQAWKDYQHVLMDSAQKIPYVYPKEMQSHSARATNVYLFSAIFNYYDYMNVGVVS
jgi:peptide/nickel transport system substrate-binding protein